MSKAEKIVKALEDLYNCCIEIKDCGRCDDCPMKSLCLEDNDVITVADLLSTETVTEFIKFAEDVEPIRDKWDYEADEWNLRRGDPEDM